MAQQTAVEWYTEQLRNLALDPNHHIGLGDIRLTQGHIDDLLEQAKAMEKEQIEDAFQLGKWNGYESAKDISEMKDPTEYYNETYRK